MSDNLKNTTRNIIFLAFITIILACLYGIYFDLSTSERNEPLYLSLFIISNLFFGIILIISLVDAFTNRDSKMEKESLDNRKAEILRVSKRFPKGSEELPSELVGKNYKYYHNAFEKSGNVWRTILFAIVAVFVFVSFIISYLKHPADTRDNAGYIIAVVIASLALTAHLGMLFYQVHEILNLDKTESIPSIMKYQRIDNENNEKDSNRFNRFNEKDSNRFNRFNEKNFKRTEYNDNEF